MSARARAARTVSASVSTISADSKCSRLISRSASRRSAMTKLRFSGGVPEPSGAAAGEGAVAEAREPLQAKKRAVGAWARCGSVRCLWYVGSCRRAAERPHVWRVCRGARLCGRACVGAHLATPGTAGWAVARPPPRR